jgi:hypothetical protein
MAAKAIGLPPSLTTLEPQNANKWESVAHSSAIVHPKAIMEMMLANCNYFHIVWLCSKTTFLPVPCLSCFSFHILSLWGSNIIQ